MNLNKTYSYKVYDTNGNYLGLLQNVTSDFSFNQNIATVGTQIQITVAQTTDLASKPNTPLLDQSGAQVTDESGNVIYDESVQPVVGTNTLINNNNLIQVYEYSSYHPNGLIKFNGYISKWQAVFGGDNNIIITCLNLGQDLSNYLMLSGGKAYLSQTVKDSTTFLIGQSTGTSDYKSAIQTFSLPANIQLQSVDLFINNSSASNSIAIMQIYRMAGATPNPTSDQQLSSSFGTINASTNAVVNIPVQQGTTQGGVIDILANIPYYLVVTSLDQSGSITASADANDPYPNGSAYIGTTNFSSGAFSSSNMFTQDLYFVLRSGSGNTTATYTNIDCSDLLISIMTNYKNQGGHVSIPSIGIPIINNDLTDTIYGNGNIPVSFSQAFTPTQNMTFNVLQVMASANLLTYKNTGGTPLKVKICTGDPSLDFGTFDNLGQSFTYTFTLGSGNSIIATSNTVNLVNTIPRPVGVTFNTPVTLTAGTQYYLLIDEGASGTNGFPLTFGGGGVGDSVPSYIGKGYSINFIQGQTLPSTIPANFIGYINFKLYYFATIPSVIDNGYIFTGNLVSYTFKQQTILQSIQTVESFAPANWYWYVDPATNTLYFQEANSIADIQLIKGRHINEIDITATKESIINDVYFTGGDDGTGTNTNILVEVTATQGTNRKGLAQISDNRVNSTTGGLTVAQQIAQEYINDNNSETYISNVTLIDETIDLSILSLGKVIGFAGFGNFVDQLLLQIVGINISPDNAVLQIGTLPVRQSKVVSQIESQLAYVQTVDNNVIPS